MDETASPEEVRASTANDYAKLLDLQGRGFVVPGTGPGIGRETCRAFTHAGGRVLCVGRASPPAQ